MRHGETYASLPEAKLPTAAEDAHLPLTARGRERVAEVSRWLADVQVGAVYSSPYLRSRETARAIAEPHRLEPIALEGLEELAVHPPPGGTLADVARRYIGLVRDLAEKSEHDVLLDCGRSLGTVVDGAVARIREALVASEGTLVVVAHGGLNRFLLARWLGMPAVRAIAIEQNFACVNVVEFVGSGHPFVRTINCTLHDPLKLWERGF
jgi:broad specificity phosphatase PhoE